MNKEEIEHKIIRDNCKHYHLINELLAIRCKKNEKEEYTICVDGYISIDSIKETIELENKVEQLENKVKEQDREKQVVIDKLNKTIDKANEVINDQEFRYIEEVIDEEWVRRKLAQELLNLIKGEKNV